MAISLIFSISIFGMFSVEVRDRLSGLQTILLQNDNGEYIAPPPQNFLNIRKQQSEAADLHLAVALFYANVAVLVFGGAGAYFLAKRTLDPIEKAHEAQSRFVSDASHELRTPLAAMKMQIEVALRETALTDTEIRELLESNLEEIDKLSQLSTVLLQLSRFEHDEIEMKNISLAPIIKSAVNRLDKKGVRVELHTQTAHIEGNAPSIEELATILIDNALKYSPAKSHVEVSLTHDETHVILTVANSGSGIPAEHLAYIFDRFYRVTSSRSSQHTSGFGLGLSLAKQITELHRGDITVDSAVNGVTTFTVHLPRI